MGSIGRKSREKRLCLSIRVYVLRALGVRVGVEGKQASILVGYARGKAMLGMVCLVLALNWA